MEEVKLVREEMYKRVQELIRQKGTSGGRAALANLRRGIGKMPGEMPELWGVFLNKMSPELFSKSNEPSMAEWAIYISMTMFALHQQGSTEAVHCEGRSLGSAAADLMEEKTDENRERIMRRFGPVVTAKDMPELSHHIRGLVPLTTLRFGVRADKEGVLLKDFHTVQVPGEKHPEVSYRYYLSDAVFLVALGSDDKSLLESIASALQKPVYPLYLGRKSCPPTLPIVLGVKDEDILTALKTEPYLYKNAHRKSVRISYEFTSGGAMVQDIPLSFSQLHRKHGWRMKREELLTVDSNPEHDAFSEL